MSKNNQEKLEGAIRTLKDMKSTLQSMHADFKPLFQGNRSLNKEYQNLSDKVDAAIANLINPTLSLATIGTTSAGKSTIVNGLTGRTIAPMETKEMSAGVLRLLPHSDITLEIEKSSSWESGKFYPISDAEAYSKISTVFQTYHNLLKASEPPFVTVTGPLLWQKHPELIGLPKNVNLQFVDLPGLKTVGDKKNMEVIKSYLSKSVCIVAMDYADVDESRINVLLSELKDIVEALGGNDEFILFLLNKVDLRNNSNARLSTRIDELTSLIKKTLPLKHKDNVCVLPFSALMLYYAQSISGTNHYTSPCFSLENLESLGELLRIYASRFEHDREEKVKSAYNNIRQCFEVIYDNFDEPCGTKLIKTPSIEDVKTIVEASFRMSHANSFFDSLKSRIDMAFEYMVIYPSVNELFKSLDDFCTKIQTQISIKRSTQKRALIMNQISLLKEKIKLVGCSSIKEVDGKEVCNSTDYESYQSEITSFETSIKALSSDDITDAEKTIILEELDDLSNLVEHEPPGRISDLLNSIEKNTREIATGLIDITQSGDNFAPKVNEFFTKLQGKNSAVTIFDKIIFVPKDIKEQLDSQVVKNVQKCLDERKNAEVLRETLKRYISPRLIKPLLLSYNSLRDLFIKWDDAKRYKDTGSTYLFDEKNAKPFSDTELKIISDIYRSFNLRIRELLSKKTYMQLELQSGHFTETLRAFLRIESQQILSEVTSSLGADASSLKTYINNAFDNIGKVEIQLPKELFEIASPSFEPTKSLEKKWQVIGKKIVDDSACPNIRHKYRETDDYVLKEVTHYTNSFPTAKGLAAIWSNSIKASESLFWMVLSQWILKTVKDYMSQLSLISLQSVKEIDEMIAQRLDELRSESTDFEEQMSHLEDLKNKLLDTKKQFNF